MKMQGYNGSQLWDTSFAVQVRRCASLVGNRLWCFRFALFWAVYNAFAVLVSRCSKGALGHLHFTWMLQGCGSSSCGTFVSQCDFLIAHVLHPAGHHFHGAGPRVCWLPEAGARLCGAVPGASH